jgi:hypothetical protein
MRRERDERAIRRCLTWGKKQVRGYISALLIYRYRPGAPAQQLVADDRGNVEAEISGNLTSRAGS